MTLVELVKEERGEAPSMNPGLRPMSENERDPEKDHDAEEAQDDNHDHNAMDDRQSHREVNATDDPHGEFQGQEMRPSNDRMGRAKVEANAPGDELPGPETGGRLSDSRIEGCRPEEMAGSTIESQEQALARELEIERTRLRLSADDREERTREVVTDQFLRRTKEGGIPLADQRPDVPLVRRTPDDAAPLEEWQPDVPLDGLDADVQDRAAEAAARIATETDTVWGPQEVQRRLGRRLRRGESFETAVFELAKEARRRPPQGPYNPLDLADLEDCAHYRVHVEARVEQLWSEDPDSGIHQVGLLTDDTGSAKLTVWQSAQRNGLSVSYQEPGCPDTYDRAYAGRLHEGDRIKVWNATASTYRGRVTLTVDSSAKVTFLEKVPRTGGASATGAGEAPEWDEGDFEDPAVERALGDCEFERFFECQNGHQPERIESNKNVTRGAFRGTCPECEAPARLVVPGEPLS